MDSEIWKDINGYEGQYQISNFGRVKSLPREILNSKGFIITIKGRIFKAGTDSSGYNHVNLSKNNKIKTHRVHRLVAENFIDNPNNLPAVNHKDNDRKNNNFDNLEWVSNRENNSYRKNKNQTSSQFIGVWYDIRTQKWASSIYHNKKNINFGYYDSELEAYQARLKYEQDNSIVNKYSIKHS